MIIALFALSIAMIVGGIASVVQGFPFVRLESGLAMTIAGAATASAGAVLLGIAVLSGQIRRLGRQIATAAPAVATPPTREFVSQPTLSEPVRADLDPSDRDASEPKLQTGRRPAIAGGSAGLAADAAHAGGSAQMRPEPTFEEPAAPAPISAEPLLPDLLPPREAEVMRDTSRRKGPTSQDEHQAPHVGAESRAHAEVEPEPGDATLFAPSEQPIPSFEAPALRPALDDEPTPVPAAEEPAEPALVVVGTYVSGGNTYVMFSDGSIEAETPRGRFTFESLEELKAFVEAGGEGETRGVA